MKKCPECNKELDKYGIACQYCGHVSEMREKKKRGLPNFLSWLHKITSRS